MKFSYAIKKGIHIIFRTIEVLIALLIVTFGLTLGRLYLYPVEIKEYLPTIEKYLFPKESDLKLDAGSVTLHVAFEKSGLLHISMSDVSLLRSDNQLILNLPEVDIAYRWGNIIRLNYTPNDLSIRDATLQLMIDPDGHIRLHGGKISDKNPAGNGVLFSSDQMEKIDKFINGLKALNAIRLENANILIDDRQKGEKLSLPTVNLDVEKQPDYKHALRLTATADIQGRLTHLTWESELDRIEHQVNFNIDFDRLYAKDLSRAIPVLKGADLTVGGHLSGLFDFGPNCSDILSCFQGGIFKIKIIEPGTLDLPDDLTNLYHIQSGTINGAIDSGMKEIKIGKSLIELTDGPSATLGLSVTGLDKLLNGEDIQELKTVLKSTISSLPMTQVPSIWPVGTGPDAHTWVRENLTAGTVEKADFVLYFSGGDLVDLYGEIPVKNVRVRFLDTMSPIQDMAGTVQLYPDRVLIMADKGHINHLVLEKAIVDLTDVDKDIPQAKIVLDIQGPLQEALNLIAEEPLAFPQMFGLDPSKTAGKGTVHVDLDFPLTDDLQPKDVTVMVSADIKDSIFPLPFDDKYLSGGNYHLDVNNNRLTLQGTAKFNDIPLTLSWTENFTAQKPTDIRTSYQLSSDISTSGITQILPVLNSWLSGTISANADIQITQSDKISADIQLDLTQTGLNLFPITTQKPIGVPTTGKIALENQGGRTKLDYTLTGSTDDKGLNPLSVKGSALIDKGITLQIKELIAPRNNLNADIRIQPDDWNIKVHGQSWDGSGLYSDDDSEEKKETVDDDPTPGYLPHNLHLDIDLKRLFLTADEPITSLTVKANRQSDQWQNLSLNAVADQPFHLSYGAKKKTLTAYTPDLGDLLNRLGISKKIKEGSFSLQATQTKIGVFEASAEMKNLSLRDTGFLLQAMTILGIVDAFRGKDLFFQSGSIPLKFEELPTLRLTINEGYLSGTNLGMTFDGTAAVEAVDLAGSVIPAYAINSLPGKIPLIGGLFKDGDGGGLIGVKYHLSGPLSNIGISFDALKSMAPGILGKLFR